MRKIALGATGMAALLALAGALAQAAAVQPPVWGYVDMEKLAAGYTAMQNLNQQLQQFRAERDSELDTRHKARLLSDEEQREFLDLFAMGAPTEQRTKRLKELEELSNQRERKLFDLREKSGRTPEEEQEFKYLSGIYEKRMTELGALQQDRDKAVTATYEELSRIVTDSVDAAVKAVGEEQKLAIVLRKEVVLWGGTDITDAVVAKLNAPAAK